VVFSKHDLRSTGGNTESAASQVHTKLRDYPRSTQRRHRSGVWIDSDQGLSGEVRVYDCVCVPARTARRDRARRPRRQRDSHASQHPHSPHL